MLRIIKIIIISVVFLNTIYSQDRYESFSTWVKSVPEYGFNGMKNSVTQKSNLLILETAGIGALLAYQIDNQVQN